MPLYKNFSVLEALRHEFHSASYNVDMPRGETQLTSLSLYCSSLVMMSMTKGRPQEGGERAKGLSAPPPGPAASRHNQLLGWL